jgi:flagellar hook-associated protein 3 FlgL
MRISTSTIYDQNVGTMDQLQASLLHTQQQISTGKRILTPADDPAAASQVIQVNQSIALNTQLSSTNAGTAQTTLSLAQSTLQSVTTLLQNVQSTAVSAGNASLTNADRQNLAASLQTQLDQLAALANSTDGAGNYLFSGFQNTQPFSESASGTQYLGDNGQRMVQVSPSSQMAVTDNGANIFMRIKNGNGDFATSASSSNSGTGIISQGSLAAPPPSAQQMGNTYQITFSVAGGVTTYTVTGTDASGNALPNAGQPGALPTAVPYVSGQNISFNGLQFNIQGAPADGDVFTVKPSTNVSVFKTLSDLISALQTPIPSGSASASAAFNQSLNSSLNDLGQAIDHMLGIQASMGTNLNELTTLQAQGTQIGTEYQQTLSQLQDTNMTQAASELAQQQTSLQAAQQSFVKVAGLSLFNYL